MVKKIILLTFLISIQQFYCNSQSIVESVSKAKLFKKDRAASCKPKTNYSRKKKKSSNGTNNEKSGTTPYKYVYNSKSAAPPATASVSEKAPVSPQNVDKLSKQDNSSSNNKNKTASTASSNSNKNNPTSILKNMPPDKRKKEVLEMPPTRELEPIRFISAQDEFSVVNMDSFMEALELIGKGKMVLVEGHTDDKGSDEYNLQLSMKRVEKIRQLLLDAGADDNLISVIGYGERKPLVPNTTEENREINRRIEFKIFDLE